ncbi:MAG: hypothetical protein WCG91_01140 [Candidatus Shapirobacteria bacterium]
MKKTVICLGKVVDLTEITNISEGFISDRGSYFIVSLLSGEEITLPCYGYCPADLEPKRNNLIKKWTKYRNSQK